MTLEVTSQKKKNDDEKRNENIILFLLRNFSNPRIWVNSPLGPYSNKDVDLQVTSLKLPKKVQKIYSTSMNIKKYK